MSRQPPFRYLTRDEYQELTLDERMDYLRGLMADLREKLEETRRQAERINSKDEQDS